MTSIYDPDYQATLDVLHEVADERLAQRDKWGNEHDDGWNRAQWQILHQHRLDQVKTAGLCFGMDSNPHRTQLIRAIAVLAAHIEAIDRRAVE